MFIYLSKKIAIPNNTRLNCLAWNKEQGYIAVGGNDGMLKVLKLDSGDAKMKGLAAPSNLSMNQTLEGHSGEVQVIVWNEIHQKLTTSDQYGLIIVWMLYKGSWYEEMINNRNKSVVKGMCWSSDGQKICIAYEDGAIIVGSVDGNRIWGKEMKGVHLSSVQWSPNGKNLLFGIQNGEVHIFDNQGNFLTKLAVRFGSMVSSASKTIVTLDWYDGKQGRADRNCPCLAVCYHSGHLQLMRNEYDDDPVIVDTGMRAVCCKWNHNGSIIAVVGGMMLPSENRESNAIQFFSPFGDHIRTLKVPGESVSCCVWENNSLRVALAVDSHIYFANIRPDYKWASINDGRVVVYAYNSASATSGTSICFWDAKKNETHVKNVSGLANLASFNSNCVVALRTNDENGKFKLLLFNSMATLMDAKDVDVEPLCLAINSSHAFVASKSKFAAWAFKIPKLHSAAHAIHRKMRTYHVDDIPCGVSDVIQDLDASFVPVATEEASESTADPICCVAASDKVLLIARECGIIQHYALPHVTLVTRYSQHSRPYAISLNCDSTRCAVIDASGVLSFRAIEESNEFGVRARGRSGESVRVERRDVWAMCWASDNPSLLATMEKTRMYILRNDEPEEPIVSAGYICAFKDLRVRAVLLDEIMKRPEEPLPDHVLDLEVKSLRDTRELLDKVGIPETINFIEDNPHPILWKLLAESAVKSLDLDTAESAFVRYSNVQGLNLVKRLRSIHGESLRRAEVSAFLGDYDETERIYLEMERTDLAIQLRERLGDWFRVSQLAKLGSSASDVRHERTCDSIGDYYVDRQNWKSAREYYEKSKNVEKELMCAYMTEDWDGLRSLVASLDTEHRPLLRKVGLMLANVGICDEAVELLVKGGDVETAIDCCISLSRWSEAIGLAVRHRYPAVSKLLASNAKQLIDSGKMLEAVDFLMRARQNVEAAKLMFLVAREEEEAKKRKNPVYVKKLYVLAALIVEERQRTSGVEEFSSSVDGDAEVLADPWRRAEAYHFLAVAQRQLHGGDVDAATRTALGLESYDDVLDPEDIYRLIALSSAASHHYATCSRALCRLRGLPKIPRERREAYEALAVDLFSRNAPRNPKVDRAECSACSTLVSAPSTRCPSCKLEFPVCVITGSPLRESDPWVCGVCRHKASSREAALRRSCALCHAAVSRPRDPDPRSSAALQR